ncbi:MAG: hydroxyacylglutathione hydrolase [Alphaproteobacteria bacterium]|nr:hydroxyacylglutathione hydrolase [Alphaproteobacteria bacterium]
MPLEIQQIPALRDNYVYLLREPKSGAVGAVDPSVAAPVLAALSSRGWNLTHIINTHHHPDHTGGNLDLKAATKAIIVGPLADKGRIPGIDVAVGDGDTFKFGDEAATVFDVPGHTRGHIAYWFKDSQALFSGDTLFLMGCGRLFEGTPQQMWSSLSKLKNLPPATRVYCGHEYTQANARFALTVEPKNADLVARAKRVDAARAAGKSTVPGTMADELATNPFLRADVPDLQRAMGAPGDAVATFAAIRKAKDNF